MAEPSTTLQPTLEAMPVLPLRVTVKVKGVEPLLPSALLALLAVMQRVGRVSSLRMVPVALAVPRVAPVGVVRFT